MTPKSTPFAAFMAATTTLGADVPEWVMLLPPGEVRTEDGRPGFTWDGGTVKLCSWDGQDEVARVPVDVNHANSKLGPLGQDTPAHGWIVELAAREGALWGRVDWNESGKQMLVNRSYRGISGEFMVSAASGRVFGVRGASLTNHANIKGLKPILNSIATENDENMDKLLAVLCAALTLKADAGEDAVVAAVKKLVEDQSTAKAQLMAVAKAAGAPDTADHAAVLMAVQGLTDPAKMVPVSVVEGLRAELQSITTKFNTQESAAAKQRAEAFVDGAVKAGHVGVKPMRDHYVARHMSSAAEAANVEKEIGSLPKMAGGAIITTPAPAGAGSELSEADTVVAKAMGVDPAEMKKIRAAEAANKEAA
jgi:hypothetical protein